MPNFLFEFTDTAIQEVATIIEADTQEEAKEKFGIGDWQARIKSEEPVARTTPVITQVDFKTAQAFAWKNPIAAMSKTSRRRSC